MRRHALHFPQRRLPRLIDELVELGGQNIAFTGGEPLCYPGLKSIVACCRGLGLNVHLFSSGIVASRSVERRPATAMLRALAHDLAGVAFSVYAASDELHDSITSVRQVHRFAQVFAAKEAVSKALGASLHPWAWREIEVVGESSGKCVVRLLESMSAIDGAAGSGAWSVALGRCHSLAVAVAIRSSDKCRG